MSVFEGYVFEIERSYQTENNYHKIRNIYWFDSFKNKTINNDGSMPVSYTHLTLPTKA